MNLPIDVNIDATSLSASGCLLHFTRKVVEGYRQNHGHGASMVYGIAVHKFIDTMFKTGDMKVARAAAVKAFSMSKIDHGKKLYLSDERHMNTTCVMYWQDVIQKEEKFDIIKLPNGEPATEQTFRFLYYTDEYVRIWLCGTMDKIGKFKNGCFAIGDYKSTSARSDSPIAIKTYFSSYQLSCQLRFYKFALLWMAEHQPQSVLGQIGATARVFIDALFIRPKVVENVYERSDVYELTTEHMVEFKALLDMKIQELVTAVQVIHAGGRPFKYGILNGNCETKWGKCEFWSVCKQQDDKIANLVLARDFHQKNFDPLKYNED